MARRTVAAVVVGVGGCLCGRPLLTKTLLVSGLTAGGTGDGPRLIARDKATDEIVGSVDLPGPSSGRPMTCLHAGRQLIALALGGEVPALIALGLP